MTQRPQQADADARPWPAEGRRKGALDPLELAEAAVLADVTVALCLLGWLFPAGLGTVLVAMAVAPMAALAARHRFRAVVAGAATGGCTSLLVAGTGLTINVAACAVLGALVGRALCRGWGLRRTLIAATLILWPPAAVGGDIVFGLLGQLRRLTLEQVTNSWHGTRHWLNRLGLHAVVRIGDPTVRWLVVHWYVAAPAGLLAATWLSVFLSYRLARPTLRRLDEALPAPAQRPAPDTREPVDPVPVSLDGVSFRYPGAGWDAISDLSLAIEPREFVAVVGPNGSGKSTLARLLAGRCAPTAGTLSRPGSPGLGLDGGTAMVFQRPETQVLGVRVRDDVVWGLPADHAVDVPGLLASVGLGGLADRETSSLSGGELQRLALASALARQPRLLISDETTAMVDPAGRPELLALFRRQAVTGTAVVHVTHRREETAAADRIVPMGDATAISQSPRPVPYDVRTGADAPARPRMPIVGLRGVGHVYDEGSPWAHRALTAVDLTLSEGERVLVVGPNGSGKSTLAWILAGLLVPSEGTAILRGHPLDECLGEVGLALQHARLQLLQSTVRADVRAAAGVDRPTADMALRQVGLDPDELGDQRVDELSGGQQRRVALAGLLAGHPRVLVLDEPFAGLDQEGRESLVAVLNGLGDTAGGLTLVVVTHDFEGAAQVADRVVALEGGRVAWDGPLAEWPGAQTTSPSRPGELQPANGQLSQPASSGAPRGRRRRELHLLRVVPGDSVVHRLWAGTKLLGLAALAISLSLRPGWPSIGVGAATIALGLAVAHIPRTAVPHLPRWFWIAIAIGAFLTASAGGPPHLHFGPVSLGLGALGEWARATSFGAVLLVAAALVSWTTPLAAIGPAVRRLFGPLRRTRLPVDEWAVSIALGIRCLPLLLDEVRSLAAVRRLRAARVRAARLAQGISRRHERRSWRRRLAEPQHLLTACLVVAVRRGSELAGAIEARGGFGRFADDDTGPARRDAVALVMVAVAVAAILLV